jgi:hypothetical protein
MGQDSQEIARFPIAVTSGEPVVLAVNLSGVADDPLLVRRGLWEDALYRSIRKQNDAFRELRELVKAPGKREAALARAQEELQALRRELDRLGRSEESLRKESDGKLDLAEGEGRLAELARGEDELKDFIQRQQSILNREKDPKRKELEEKVQQANLLEREAEFGKAIELYQAALDGGLDDDKLREHLNELKKGWLCKDARHQKARDFIYQTWPQFDLATFSTRIDEARDALKVCRDAGDSLTPRRLLRVAVDHLGKVREKLVKLNPDEKEIDRKPAEQLGKAAEKLAALIRDVSAMLQAER